MSDQDTTLYHAAKAYFTVLGNLQVATSIYQAVFDGVSVEWDADVRQSVANLRPMGDQIVVACQEFVAAKLPGWKQVEVLGRVTLPALDETIQMLEEPAERPLGTLRGTTRFSPTASWRGPQIGHFPPGGRGGGGWFATFLDFLERFTWKHTKGAVFSGLSVIVVVGAGVLFIKHFVLKGEPWEEVVEGLKGETARHQAALAAAAGDPDAIRAETVLHAEVMAALKANAPDAECSLLSTPLGTLLGGVAGIAVGHSGLRRLLGAF